MTVKVHDIEQSALTVNMQNAYKGALIHLTYFAENAQNAQKTARMAKQLADCFQNGHKILICGNGGSACDAQHFAEEFTGQYRKPRKALPVISLLDPAFLTCVSNDFGFEEVFSRGVEAFGKPGDWLIVLSTSGNSKNIIKAVSKASSMGVKTLALLGKTGGALKGICDEEFIIEGLTSDRIQEIHMLILHVLIEGVERLLFPDNYAMP